MTVPSMETVRPPLSTWLAALCLALPYIEAPAEATAAPSGTTPPAESAAIDYQRQVKPIFTRHCVGCHGAVKPRGGLRLDTAAAALKGGKSGPAIVVGQGNESPIITAVRGDGPGERMPLNRPPLTASDIKLLKDWIDQGASADAGRTTGIGAEPCALGVCRTQQADCPGRREHALGSKRDRPFHSGPARASRSAAVRRSRAGDTTARASLDLVGLPPSPEEIAIFLADRSAVCS